jgi:transposase-like protein
VKKQVKEIYRYSESLKQKIAEEVGKGEVSVSEAQERYGVKCRRTINRWVMDYGYRNYETQVVRVIMKSEQERIEELEKALADEKLMSLVYRSQLESYQGYVPDLKKKLNMKDLKTFEENERKLKNMV